MLTSSSYTGAGLGDVWAAVMAHHQGLQASGGLERLRHEQQLEWLRALVDEEILGALKRSPGVRSINADIKERVKSGDMSAIEGAERIVAAFVHDVPELWPQFDP